MKNITEYLSRSAFIFIVIVIGSIVISAQENFSGTWSSNKTDWSKKHKDKVKGDDENNYEFEFHSENADKLNIQFRFDGERGKRNSQGSSFSYEELNGLSRSQVESANSAVNFTIDREAGKIDLRGTFQNGKGEGTFVFTPNRNFAESMRSRGFEFDTEKQFAATTLNVTTSLADDLRSSNLKNLDVDDLFKAKIFKIDSAYINEMTATGFPNLDMEDLVKARIFKIDAAFMREVVAMGFQEKSLDDLVKFRIFKITPQFLRDMQNAGFTNIDSEDAVKLRIFKVTPEFIREMQAEGLANLTVEQATKLRIFKIDAEFIRQARAENVPITVEDLVKRKIGVHKR